MPCDQVRTQNADLNVANLDVLQAALEALGFTVTLHTDRRITGIKIGTVVSWFDGKLTTQGLDYTTTIKKEYTRQAFRTAAESKGFRVYTVGEKLVARKRRY